MPMFMDIHGHVEGRSTDAAVQANDADMQTQAQSSAKYLRYWFDKHAGKVFCLHEAANKEAAIAMHREAQ